MIILDWLTEYLGAGALIKCRSSDFFNKKKSYSLLSAISSLSRNLFASSRLWPSAVRELTAPSSLLLVESILQLLSLISKSWLCFEFSSRIQNKRPMDGSKKLHRNLSFFSGTNLMKNVHSPFIYSFNCNYTKFPQKKHGPLPSCSQTTRPQFKQFLIRLCIRAWQLQDQRPCKYLNVAFW